MRIINLLFLLLIVPLASAITITPGVIIETVNATWNFTTENVSVTTLIVGNDYLMFNNDNISLVPDNPSNISIINWVSSSDHEFTFTGASNLSYNISIYGISGAIKYGGNYYKSPFVTIASAITWYYLFDREYEVYFYDEDTHSLVSGVNVSISFISEPYATNYTTITGTLNANIPSDVYLVRYSGDGYTERFYRLDVTDYTTGTLNLYMIKSSDNANITVNVIDQFVIPVENAVVKALKYDISTNTYLLQEVMVTNSEGTGIMHLTYGDEYYKFIVVVDDDIKLTTNPQYINSNSLTLQIVLGEGFGDDYYQFADIDYSLVYNDATNNFRYTWNDDSGFSSEFCLKTYRVTAINEYLINSTCVSAAAGTILHSINPVNGTMFISKAYYTGNAGATRLLDSVSKSFSGNVSTGISGLVLQLLLTLAFAFLAVWSVPVSAIATPTSLIFGRFIGLNAIGYEYLIPIFIVGVIVAYITSNKS